MKKSRMLLLFGGLFLMLVGYVAWCGRTFYLRAPVPDVAVLPAEARALALAEIEAADLRRPEKFSISRFKHVMMHPYESESSSIWIEVTGLDSAIVVRSDLTAGLSLTKDENEWLSRDLASKFWK